MSVSKISMAMLALSGAGVNAALQPIIAKGQKLFYENGTQFFMKGIAYQEDELPGGRALPATTPFIDPLADVEQCRRDIPKLEELGVNTIRTYAINATADHTECMRMLDEAGIYVISDLSHPRLSINREAGDWNLALYDRYTSVIDELAQFDNVIGFFAGNEVTNNASYTPASAYVKAAVRDMKAHIRERNYRWMGVGYANNDDTEIREDIAHYFNCGREEDSVDFWGYNIYSWCDRSDMQRSGYDKQVEFFTDYGVPVFFAEYGCIDASSAEDRIWQDTEVLYTDAMTGVFSGGLVFKYQQDAALFGVVEINRDGSATEFDSFDRLARAHRNARPNGVNMDDYSTDFTTPQQCPEASETWDASAVLPPTPDRELCECAAAASPCGPSGTLDEEDMAEIFNFICDASPESCVGIGHNASSGVYGAYSMCGQAHKLAHILGAYYENTNRAFDSCDFDGRAETKSDTSDSSCRDPLASAAERNEAAATQTQGDPASITGGSGSGGSSNGGSGSNNDDESFGLSSITMTRTFGNLAVGLYLAVAGAAGAAMVML